MSRLAPLLALLLLLFATDAIAQRRRTRPCPGVVPDGELCTRFVQGQMCRYGRNTTCICHRRSARDRQPRWSCTP